MVRYIVLDFLYVMFFTKYLNILNKINKANKLILSNLSILN